MKKIIFILLFIFLFFSPNVSAQTDCSNYVFSSYFGTQGSPPPGAFPLHFPSGLAIDSSNYIYVADPGNQRVQKFTPDGLYFFHWISSTHQPFSISEVVVDSNHGFFYIVDSVNETVQKFTLTGQFQRSWGGSGTDYGRFNNPSGIGVDLNGNVYIADTSNNRVQKFTTDGVFITSWEPFSLPYDVAVDSQGYVYVVAYELLNKYTSTGTLVNSWTTSEIAQETFFSQPISISIDSANNLYILFNWYEDHISLLKTDNNASLLKKIKWANGSLNGQFNNPKSIAVTSSGDFYIADSGNNRVQKFVCNTAVSHCQPLGNIDCTSNVSVSDLNTLISQYSTSDSLADLDDSGSVNSLDLSILLLNYGKTQIIPTPTSSPSNWWKPTTTAPIHFHWQIGTDFNPATDFLPGVTLYDIDGFNTPASTVTAIHDRGYIAICYVDVGGWESDRPDASAFPASVRGNKMEGWPEYYLDIRSQIVRDGMANRIKTQCADKGFDAVEPDVIDAYANNSGFPLTYQDQISYNRFLADTIHSYGMSAGLKGDTDQAMDLAPYFDWTLNEECAAYDECDNLNNFLTANKAVFQVEYTGGTSFCPDANANHRNAQRRNLDLTKGGTRVVCIPDSQNTW